MGDFQKRKIFDFSSFVALNPTKYSLIDPKRLQWFIGFSEGDGSFGIIKSPNHRNRCSYCINQADLRVLKNVQEILGFGAITTYTQKTKLTTGFEDRIYGRFMVKNPQEVEILIHLFNGNLHIKKCQKTFETWVLTYNDLYNTDIKIKPIGEHKRISLDNGWLVGFWEADGGFSASFTSKLTIRAFIDQDDEEMLLKHISSLFGSTSVYLRKETKSVYRADFTAHAAVVKISLYCTYLGGRKKDVFDVWVEIISYLHDKNHLKPGNFPILKKLVDRLQYLNKIFKIKKSVLVVEELDGNDPNL